MMRKLPRQARAIGLLCLAFFIYQAAQAQTTIRVSGKVLDSATQKPLEGVSVSVMQATTGASTNANGEFAFNAPSGSTLVFTYAGYNEQTVRATANTINIRLGNGTSQLTEVVVTALGIKKEVKRIGYSTQEVKGDDLTKARDANPVNSLAGRVAGLNVGASAEILGRPQLVLRGSTDLLFVVDGVPVNSDTWNISADDIDTYTILKGPNAAALYGFRGQNGAILITTKRGTKDKRGFNVSFNSSNMIEKGFIVLPQQQTQYGYGTAYQYDYGSGLYSTSATAGSGSFRANIWGPLLDGQLIRQYDSPIDPTTGIRGKSPWIARGVDNFKNFIETGLLSTTNVAVAASGSNYDIRTSYSHTYQKGMAPNTKLNIDNLNIGGDFTFNSKLKLESNLNLSVQYTPNIPDVAYGPNSYPYMFKVYGSASWDIADMKDYYKAPANNPLGKPGLQQYYAEYGRENNPYFVAHEWLHGHNKTDIYGYAKLTYTFSKDLSLFVRSQITTWDQTRTEKVPASTVLNSYLGSSAGTPFTAWSPAYTGDYREDNRRLIENNSDFLLSYNKRVSDFYVAANLGGSERSFSYHSTWSSSNWLSTPGVYTLSNSRNPVKAYSWDSKMQVYSAYATLDFGYKNYFNIGATGRFDHLSTLPIANRTTFYPSVSVSSVITDYIKTLPRVISYVKIRGSFADVRGGFTRSTITSAYAASTGFTRTVNSGLLGYGSEIVTSYDGPNYINQYSYTSSTYYNGTPSVDFSTAVPNENIKAFNVGSYEAGLDMKFFRNRLGFEGTFFRSTNGPAATRLPVASSTAYQTQLQNAITSLKKGVELSLTGTVIKSRNFSWDVLLNWSTYRETLKDIYQGETQITINNHNYQIGDRLDGYYGTKFVRSPDGQIVHAGGIPLAPQTGINNLQLLGHLNPDFSFGINNRFTYKNLSLMFQFDGRVGGVLYDYTWAQSMNSGNAIETTLGDYGVARLKDGQAASMNGGSLPAGYTGSYVGPGVVITSGTPMYVNGVLTNSKDLTFAPNTVATTVQNYVANGVYGLGFDEAFLIKRTFAKLREVSLSYTLPSRVLGNRSFIRSLTVSLVGRNLLYFAQRKDVDLDQYANGFNLTDLSTNGLRGYSTDLQSATARRYGINLNFGF